MAQLAGIEGYIWAIPQCSIQSDPPLKSRANAHATVARTYDTFNTCAQRHNNCLFMVSFSSRSPGDHKGAPSPLFSQKYGTIHMWLGTEFPRKVRNIQAPGSFRHPVSRDSLPQ